MSIKYRMADKLNDSEISKSNPVRLLDLNKYLLSDKQINDPQLRKWTKELIYKFTKNNLYNKEYKNTVNKNVYTLPLNTQLSNYGARHFVMKEQCQLNPKEIDELRAEAKDIHSPYWYGMISTCHHSGHITLKIANMLFPDVKWKLVKTPNHTFVSNMSDDNIKKLFGNDYTMDNLMKTNKNVYNKGFKDRLDEIENLIIDKADFDKSAPMIIDILLTNKKMFLDLVTFIPKMFIRIYPSSSEYIRSEYLKSKNVEEIPLTKKARNIIMKIKKTIYNTFTQKNKTRKIYKRLNHNII